MSQEPSSLHGQHNMTGLTGGAHKCPYAGLIAMGPQAAMKDIHEIARNLNILIQDTKDNSENAAMERYFGSPNLHPSIFLEVERFSEGKTPTSPERLPKYAALIGNLHNIFRVDIPKTLDIHLDEERLDESTQHLLKDFRRLALDYRHDVVQTKKTRKGLLPLYSAMTETSLHEFDRNSHLIVEALRSSQLADSSAKIPLIIGGKHVEIANTDRLGLFLFTLDMSRHHQLDINKIPYNISKFLSETVTTTSSIPLVVSSMLDSDPALQARRNTAYGEALHKINTLLGEDARAIQMANLLSNKFVIKDKGERKHTDAKLLSEACTGLLTHIHMKPYPERLESPLEAGLVLQSVADRVKGHGYKRHLQAVARQCFDIDAGLLGELNHEEARKAIHDLSEISTTQSYLDVILRKDTHQLEAQAGFAKGYLERELQLEVSKPAQAYPVIRPYFLTR